MPQVAVGAGGVRMVWRCPLCLHGIGEVGVLMWVREGVVVGAKIWKVQVSEPWTRGDHLSLGL